MLANDDAFLDIERVKTREILCSTRRTEKIYLRFDQNDEHALPSLDFICVDFSKQDMKALALQTVNFHNRVERISFRFCKNFDHFLDEILCSKTLRTIVIEGTVNSTSVLQSHLECFPCVYLIRLSGVSKLLPCLSLSLTTLVLDDSPLDVKCSAFLANLLVQSTCCISHLSLRRCGLGFKSESTMLIICSAIHRQDGVNRIRSLDLSANLISSTSSSLSYLCDANLSTLRLDEIKVNYPLILDIGQILCAGFRLLKDLSFRSGRLGDEGAKIILRSLPYSLEALDLSYNDISDFSIFHLVPSLTHMKLEGNRPTVRSFGTFAGLVSCSRLQKLDISNCGLISSSAVVLLARLLFSMSSSNCPAVSHLNLSRNFVGHRFAVMLSRTIALGYPFSSISLCGNSLGESAVCQLLQSLQHHNNISKGKLVYLDVTMDAKGGTVPVRMFTADGEMVSASIQSDCIGTKPFELERKLAFVEGLLKKRFCNAARYGYRDFIIPEDIIKLILSFVRERIYRRIVFFK